MRELMLAKAYFERVSKDYTFINDSVGRYRYHLIYFVFDYIISERRVTGDVDISRLDALQAMASNSMEQRYYLDMLLDLCLDLIAMDTKQLIDELIKRIEVLTLEENTEIQRIKRAIILVSLETNTSAERFETLIGLYMPSINLENRMLLHMMTGNAYLAKEKDLYKALQHHLDALDIVHDLTMMLPIELREGYVLSDVLRIKLFESIQAIKLRMVQDSPDMIRLMNAQRVGLISAYSLETYFDIGDMEVVFDNEQFKESILESYSKRFQIRVEKAEALLQLFQRDQGYNLQLVIRYLSQLTLSQMGFIYSVNEYGEVEDVFKSENHLEAYDLDTLLKFYGDTDVGVVLEHKKRLYVERGMMPRKSSMFIPIFNTQPHDGVPHRRKYDAEDLGYKEVLGYLYLESDKLLNNINEHSFQVVKQLNNLIYVLLDTFKLKKEATIDRLTGVYLRKYIETEFNKELVEARQRQHELSVAMVDIDHFKNVNDTFGHRKGDDVLAKIGELLMHMVRHGDYVGRYGGEEFMIILPKTSAIDAYIVCEKIREKVKDSKLLGDDFPVTISIGLATFPAMAQTDEELIERADQALYESKNLGRDRTTQYNGKSAINNKRYDKLAGILSGNASNDARVLKAIVDMMNLISESTAKRTKFNNALGTLLDITEGQEATVVIGDEGDYDIFERHRGDARIKMRSRMSKSIIESFLHSQADDFFIHWNDVEDVDRMTGVPNWKSYIVCPLMVKGRSLGLVVVRVPIKEREFEFKHYNFVKQVSSVIAALIE